MRASLAAVNEALCAAIGERAIGFFGDEIGARGRRGCRSSGSSASLHPPRRRLLVAALDAGEIPVVAPLRSTDGAR